MLNFPIKFHGTHFHFFKYSLRIITLSKCLIVQLFSDLFLFISIHFIVSIKSLPLNFLYFIYETAINFLSLLQSFFFTSFPDSFGFSTGNILSQKDKFASFFEIFYMPQLFYFAFSCTDSQNNTDWVQIGDLLVFGWSQETILWLLSFLKEWKCWKYLLWLFTNIFTFYIRYMIIFINKPYFNKSFNHLGENVCVHNIIWLYFGINYVSYNGISYGHKQ